MHTAVMASGQDTAMTSGWSATHEVAGAAGLPNSSRVAITVAESGVHAAGAASHPGMREVGTTVSATMASGKTSAKYFIAASGPLTSNPNRMPTQENARAAVSTVRTRRGPCR